MAQQHHETTGPGPGPGPGTGAAGEALAAHLRGQATEFLRALRLHREAAADAQGAEDAVAAARALRRAARRIGGALHTFRPLLDPDWSDTLRPELSWLTGTLAHEHAYGERLARLLEALHRLAGTPPLPGPAEELAAGRRSAGRWGSPRASEAESGGGWAQPHAQSGASDGSGANAARNTPPGRRQKATPTGLTVGAAKAAALLERQLTLARTRAHSTALQALGSSRFHAVVDRVAVLASEVPLKGPGAAEAGEDLKPLAAAAEARLAEAVAALPLVQAGHPYNAGALAHGLAADAASAAARAARTPRIAPATAYALGVLHADQRHEVEAARFAFQRAWLRDPVSTR